MSIDNNDNIKHDDSDSLDSGAEGEPLSAGGDNGDNGANGANGANGNNAQDSQPIKRKGGRKPIYATSEERKQRNRQAQAAFRERRTEYIKQLEETIRVHEQNLHNLQTAHRHAADECLMLRYKNSLLERILLEKGIDVQAELRAKTGSPNLGPTHMPQNMVQPPPMPRSIINRHHARRSNSSIAPKLDVTGTSLPGAGLVGINPGHPTPTSVVASPKSRPTPSSHSASPAASTSVYGQSPAASTSDPSASIRSVMSAPAPPPPPPPAQVHQAPPVPAAAAMKAAQLGGPITGISGPHPQHTQHQQHQQAPLPSPQPATPRSASGVGGAPYYALPGFQNHIDQLEQEYDAADDIMEDPSETPDTPSGPNPYSATAFSAAPPPLSLASPATSVAPSTAPSINLGATGGNGAGAPGTAVSGGSNGYPSMTQLLDPALDWDPFGLSASMQFPTQFSFDTSNTR
ncbi:hypothetical protein SPBR_00455 [Sporothrix brasiliensis 5110]|uniref:BZIP domain-containing protein n=1 Tax=Sporothrix brasiliensis 5110 TaxID=1398154 RepID=A0A0C2INF9_9PEZI|nr:uncharacterized protein SPBR_00455 [Sporothrix brasiliensis 5110]KIH90571.1 hypothetical protein SPBR_00455 [Sporothrix brasiliensis 5110]